VADARGGGGDQSAGDRGAPTEARGAGRRESAARGRGGADDHPPPAGAPGGKIFFLSAARSRPRRRRGRAAAGRRIRAVQKKKKETADSGDPVVRGEGWCSRQSGGSLGRGCGSLTFLWVGTGVEASRRPIPGRTTSPEAHVSIPAVLSRATRGSAYPPCLGCCTACSPWRSSEQSQRSKRRRPNGNLAHGVNRPPSHRHAPGGQADRRERGAELSWHLVPAQSSPMSLYRGTRLLLPRSHVGSAAFCGRRRRAGCPYL